MQQREMRMRSVLTTAERNVVLVAASVRGDAEKTWYVLYGRDGRRTPDGKLTPTVDDVRNLLSRAKSKMAATAALEPARRLPESPEPVRAAELATTPSFDEIVGWLRELLIDGEPFPAEEGNAYALERGVSKTTLTRARAAAGVVSEKDEANNWTWRLADVPPAEDEALASLEPPAADPEPEPEVDEPELAMSTSATLSRLYEEMPSPTEAQMERMRRELQPEPESESPVTQWLRGRAAEAEAFVADITARIAENEATVASLNDVLARDAAELSKVQRILDAARFELGEPVKPPSIKPAPQPVAPPEPVVVEPPQPEPVTPVEPVVEPPETVSEPVEEPAGAVESDDVLEALNVPMTSRELATRLSVNMGALGELLRGLASEGRIQLTGEMRDQAPEWTLNGYSVASGEIPDELKDMPSAASGGPLAQRIIGAHSQKKTVDAAREHGKSFVISEFEKRLPDMPRSRIVDALNALVEQGKFIKRTGKMRHRRGSTAGRTSVEYVAVVEVAQKPVSEPVAPPAAPKLPALTQGTAAARARAKANRDAMLTYLAENGASRNRDIYGHVGISQTVSSKHLRDLVAEGLVVAEGITFRLADAAVANGNAVTEPVEEEAVASEPVAPEGDMVVHVRDKVRNRIGMFSPQQISGENEWPRDDVEEALADLAGRGILKDMSPAPDMLLYEYVRPTSPGAAAEADIRWRQEETPPPSARGGGPVPGTGRKEKINDPDVRQLVSDVERAGGIVGHAQNGHYDVTLPGGKKRMQIAATPSSRRTVMNDRVRLRREGLGV